MASVENSNSSGNGKIKKKSLVIDMTPMVDLGFLLITFFILTATVNTPVSMKFNLPKENKDEQPEAKVDERAVLNVLLDRETMYTYQGTELGTMQAADGYRALRKKIIEKQDWCQKNGFEKDFLIIIKAGDKALYQQVVDILDEMVINQSKYTFLDILPEENQYINQYMKR